MTSQLKLLRDELHRLGRFPDVPYRVPGLWVGEERPVVLPSASEFFLSSVDAAMQLDSRVSEAPRFTVMFNALVRHVTSYDHGAPALRAGWRSTGTFLKLLALLPYLRSLNVGVISLLPINVCGEVGRKGTLGSPYATRNPFAIDDHLAEPLLQLSAQTQAAAFVEAAHRNGMKVLTEVALRTASRDSDLVADHPEWFYWVRQDDQAKQAAVFAAPKFSDEEQLRIRERIDAGMRSDLPEPSLEYRRQFSDPPAVVQRTDSGWRGTTSDGEFVTIPGAFADWPPDDPQPPWSDVAYLRLHRHPHFNYMSYNTIRMFDQRLEVHEMESRSVWNMITSIIPHQLRTLNTDGALIDMGHALPLRLRQEVIAEARRAKRDSMLIEENFEIRIESALDGFSAVTGYLPFEAHSVEHLRMVVRRAEREPFPIHFMAAGESHNTPRWAQRLDPMLIPSFWAFISLIPRAIPCIVAGMELSEVRPMNTGLGFTEEEIGMWPTEKLALFSDVPLCWDDGSSMTNQFRKQIRAIKQLSVTQVFTENDGVVALESADADVVAFHRKVRGTRRGLLVLLHAGCNSQQVTVDLAHADIASIAVDERWQLVGSTVTVSAEARSLVLIPTLSYEPLTARL